MSTIKGRPRAKDLAGRTLAEKWEMELNGELAPAGSIKSIARGCADYLCDSIGVFESFECLKRISPQLTKAIFQQSCRETFWWIISKQKEQFRKGDASFLRYMADRIERAVNGPPGPARAHVMDLFLACDISSKPVPTVPEIARHLFAKGHPTTKQQIRFYLAALGLEARKGRPGRPRRKRGK